MCKNESYSSAAIKKISKYLCKTEAQFLNRLNWWASHKNEYGLELGGRTWIYNTLEDWAEQLDVSKKSIQRAIKSLKDKGIIDSNYLSPNKRNRTLFYSINYEKLQECLSELKTSMYSRVNDQANDQVNGRANGQANTTPKNINSHADGHMYYNSNSIQIYKSNKSTKIPENKTKQKPEEKRSADPLVIQKPKEKRSADPLVTKKPEENRNDDPPVIQKSTIVQDMLKIWSEEFPTSKIELTKNLARFLVAAFKMKFGSCLRAWRRYLKILKTSTFIMSEKFKLSIWWVIKFFTIDRIRAGELGVHEEKIETEPEELTEELTQHMESLEETEPCKKLRYSIAKKLSLPTYLSWFTHVNFVEDEGKIIMKAHNQFVEDWIRYNFADTCGLCLE
jgi:predicted transcriptional regulator